MIVYDRDQTHKIVYLIDENLGGKTITNGAEDVLRYWQSQLGPEWRVVYQDTENEWWEIRWGAGWGAGDWRVVFDRWNGLVWDILKRK